MPLAHLKTNTKPANEPYKTLLMGLEVMAQEPELHPIK